MPKITNYYYIVFASLVSSIASAQVEENPSSTTDQSLLPHVQLETIVVQGVSTNEQTNLLGENMNASDNLVTHQKLRQGETTLGNVLSREVGIHSNQYGGGSSAPIIRGQESKRIKILQNNAEVIDMSNMSPDHAIMVDTVLAEQIEIVRGPTTLLYSSGNAAGLVNVIDNKIPSKMPKNGFSGEVATRFNSNNHEKLLTSAVTMGLNNHVALHIEGLNRSSDDYQTAQFKLSKDDSDERDYLPNSHADSQVINLGLSWIGDTGFIGTGYSKRQDQYGLPAHNHLMHDCHVDSLAILSRFQKPYLFVYPHLMDDSDVDYDNPGLSCHSHDDDTAHAHGGDPWVDMVSERYDIRSELWQPVPWLDTVRFNASRANYHHDELEGGKSSNFFDNQGSVIRLDLSHQPLLESKLTGTWGIQYLTQENSALAPPPQEKYYLNQPLLNANKTANQSVFGMERYQTGNFTYELGLRHETQEVSMDYDIERLKVYVDELPDLSSYKDNANSVAAAIHWQFSPNSQLSLIASHQERLPSAQELYTHGFHLATNSFEIGNRHLTNEKSNNFELSFKHNDGKLDYKLSGYHYGFDNYIYLLTLNDGRGPKSLEDDDGLKLNRYSQSPAKFYGLEGSIGYQLTPEYYVALYGDYVNGRLVDMPNIPGRKDAYRNRPMIKQDDRYTPRLPPMRLGTKLEANLTDKLSANVDYQHIFKQDKLSKFEDFTPGHNMLAVGVNYKTKISDVDSVFFINGNNLLNELGYSHASFLSDIPQMGRNITMGMNFKF